ncbi:MAG: tetratricopeptide repeat protein, partial [Vicinamibacteria bacterium]
SPDNFEASRVRAFLYLGKHEFAKALEEASSLNRRAPDDLLTYALLVDANIELGNYAEAEEAAEWLLDMRPGNIPGMTRGAYLRELFGDVDGALEWMAVAYDQTPSTDLEDLAWIRTQMAHLELSRGKRDEAEHYLSEALTLFPGYHYALAELGKVRIAQERHAEAAAVLLERYRTAPHPENRYDLAVALSLAGEREEAEAEFADFEREALAESDSVDNANLELVFYYADRASKPEAALAIASKEIERRRDVFTREALAWALYRSGRTEAARAEIEAALAVGIRNARMLHHAGAICAAAGDGGSAARYFKESLSANPYSPVASEARDSLRALGSVVAP